MNLNVRNDCFWTEELYNEGDGGNHKSDKKFDGGNHKSDKKFDGGNHKRDKKFDEGESFGFHNVVCILDFDVVDRGMKFSTQLADDCRSY